MITITFWPRASRAGTIQVDLTKSSRFEADAKHATFYLCNTDGQMLLDSMWAHGMRPSHIRELQKKGSGK